MGKVTILILILLSGSCSKDNDPDIKETDSNNLLVAGYLPSYGLSRFDFKNIEHLDRIYYFSIAPDETGVFEAKSIHSDNIKILQGKLKESQELFLVVGGWKESKNIHVMAATEAKREAFSKALLQYCKTNNIAGVDLDWESYPKPVNEAHFIELVKELYNTLHPEKITFTIAVGTHHAKKAAKVVDYVDQVNLMSYGKIDADGNHAKLEKLKSWLADFSANGIAKEKMIAGVPFFGRRPPVTGDNTPIAVIYKKIVEEINPKPDVNRYGSYAFNGINLMKAKTKYLREHGYGGIMAWELSQDVSVTSEYSLLKAIYGEAKND